MRARNSNGPPGVAAHKRSSVHCHTFSVRGWRHIPHRKKHPMVAPTRRAVDHQFPPVPAPWLRICGKATHEAKSASRSATRSTCLLGRLCVAALGDLHLIYAHHRHGVRSEPTSWQRPQHQRQPGTYPAVSFTSASTRGEDRDNAMARRTGKKFWPPRNTRRGCRGDC